MERPDDSVCAAAVKQLREAHDNVVRLRDQFNCVLSSLQEESSQGDGDYAEEEEEEDEAEEEVDEADEDLLIRGDAGQLLLGIKHLNQSACNTGCRAYADNCGDENWDAEWQSESPSVQECQPQQQQQQQLEWWPTREDALATSSDQKIDGEAATAFQYRQQLVTCEEDVIGQRLDACLRVLQGGPYQDCDKCVKTLSSCDQRPIDPQELVARLNNLETLLLYLQLHFRGQLSCSRLKQLCQLKKAIGCMYGSLLKRQSEEIISDVDLLHTQLERTADFRKNWRQMPPGGEKGRFVADPIDCVPRVEAEDEWLRDYLPASEQPSLGHILADAEPLVGEQLGKRLAFSKLRGRSTRLHSSTARDSYDDMLRRFKFALMH